MFASILLNERDQKETKKHFFKKLPTGEGSRVEGTRVEENSEYPLFRLWTLTTLHSYGT